MILCSDKIDVLDCVTLKVFSSFNTFIDAFFCHLASYATEICTKLFSNVFEPCYEHVDVNPYFKTCLYDACECRGVEKDCACDAIATFAHACSLKGIHLQWREAGFCGEIINSNSSHRTGIG